MRNPSEWTEADLQALIDNQVQESLHLDYKQSRALAKSEPCRTEISKDVAAFANSDGGRIIYGIAEKNHYAEAIDEGVNAREFNREWLEQIISSNIQPRIDALRIYPISLQSRDADRVAYVVDIPQSRSRAPHQSRDKRYYKRYEFQSVPMEDYEIRDVLRRASTPDLWIEFSFASSDAARVDFATGSDISNPISLRGRIGNHSATPAEYALITIYIDSFFTRVWTELQATGTTNREGRDVETYALVWSVPPRVPIFAEANQPLPALLNFTVTSRILHGVAEFYIGYAIRSPGCSVEKFVRVIQQPSGMLRICSLAD